MMNKKRLAVLKLLFMVLSATTTLSAQIETDCSIVYYRQPNLSVDLGVGLWGIPIPTDWNKDGKMDLLVSCPDTPYKGLYYFRNIGSNQKPFFDKAVKLSNEGKSNIKLSVIQGKEYLLSPGCEWSDYQKNLYASPIRINYEGENLNKSIQRIRSYVWSYVDWENDGDLDIIAGIDTWADYGWDNAYNEQGEWTKGPLHGYLYLIENQGGKYVNSGRLISDGKDIDTYGAPNPCIADFDMDGDLDIICGEFLDGLTWFENIGSREKPSFASGRRLIDKHGKEIRFHVEMIVPMVRDFDGDGYDDLIVGDEDGRIAYVHHTKKVKNHMPLFEAPVYFQQKADLLKFGALATPWSVDWNQDGYTDLVCGNSAGELALIQNLSGGKNPVWSSPQPFLVDGKPFRIVAGVNGSVQGPAERKWGYTVPTVTDWDQDGKLDILINSIWGKVQWLRGLGGQNLEFPRDVQVDYSNEEMPQISWNWWKPSPNTLTTQWRTTPVPIDWNQDGISDLVMLDTEGYLAFYEGTMTADKKHVLKPGKRIFYGTNCSLFHSQKGVIDASEGVLRLNDKEAGQSGRRKICFADWDGDGRLDLMVDTQNVAWFRNVGNQDGKTYLEYQGNISEVKLAGHTVAPTVVDWNGDGKQHILVGAEDGHFYLFEQQTKNE